MNFMILNRSIKKKTKKVSGVQRKDIKVKR